MFGSLKYGYRECIRADDLSLESQPSSGGVLFPSFPPGALPLRLPTAYVCPDRNREQVKRQAALRSRRCEHGERRLSLPLKPIPQEPF
jgi:hypothetical protein